MRLEPGQLLLAYAQGIFPMALPSGQILWFDPDPRAILPLESFRLPRRLRRTVRQQSFEIRVNDAFERVISACAAPSPGREETWISPAIIEAYTELNRLGFAHSVEAWHQGELAGGLYGVAINSFFAGESMFTRKRDASKVTLAYLLQRLKESNFLLLDVQFLTDHLRQFGAVEIPRSEYKIRLSQALRQENGFFDDQAPAGAT